MDHYGVSGGCGGYYSRGYDNKILNNSRYGKSAFCKSPKKPPCKITNENFYDVYNYSGSDSSDEDRPYLSTRGGCQIHGTLDCYRCNLSKSSAVNFHSSVVPNRTVYLDPPAKPIVKEIIVEKEVIVEREKVLTKEEIIQKLNERKAGDEPTEIDDISCVVCFSNKRKVILRPCNHMLLCATCASIRLEQKLECPTCRTEVKDVIVIF